MTPRWQPITIGGDAPPPAGAYSPAIRAGDFLFVSGQVPRDPKTGETIGRTVEEQTRQVVKNLEAVLAAGGATLADVVQCTVHLADPELWPAFNWQEYTVWWDRANEVNSCPGRKDAQPTILGISFNFAIRSKLDLCGLRGRGECR